METKVCTKCGKEKNESDFPKIKNGIRSICKHCCYERDKESKRNYRIKNKEKLNEYNKIKMREIYKINPQLCREREKKSRIKNPNHYSELKKLRRQKYKEKIKEYNKLGHVKQRIKGYKSTEYYKDLSLRYRTKKYLKKQIGLTPPPELLETKILDLKIRRLCKTSNNSENL